MKMDIQDNARRSILFLQERQESIGERDKSGEVDRKLLVELIQVEASRVGEVDDGLGACVEEDAVDIRVCSNHAGYC